MLEANELKQESLICSVLQNWAIPIMEGKLEVQLDELLINKYNVENLFMNSQKVLRLFLQNLLNFALKQGQKKLKIKLNTN